MATDDLPPPLRARAGAVDARYVGALFAFDLDQPPAGYRYAAARFTVDTDASGVTAVLVHSGGAQLGWLADGAAAPLADRLAGSAAATGRSGLLRRLGLRDDRPAARTTGTQSGRFGWRYVDRRADPLLPRTYGTHAVLEVPAGLTALRGTIEAEVDLTGLVRRRVSSTERVEFDVPLPGAPTTRAASVRLCVAADIVAYSRFGRDAAERAQRDLVQILAAGRTAAGVGADQVSPQPQGDGQFTVLPTGLDEAAVIPRLIRAVDGALAARNADAADDPDGPLRLRLALHRGLVKEADKGWVGRAAVAVHRILDSAPLRAALSEHPRAPYVLGVPDVLFEDVLSTGEDPPPTSFRPVTVDLPTKGFHERAWLHIPGYGA